MKLTDELATRKDPKHWASRLNIVFNDAMDLRERILITGFHGLGGIGHLTVRYLVESALKQNVAKKVGYIVGQTMPPFVEVLADGEFGVPYEFFEIGDAILLLIRLQPFLEEQALLADELTRIALENKMQAIILLGGIDITAFPEGKDAPIVYVANRAFKDKIIPSIENWDIKVAPRGILVTGGVALFLAYATHRNIPAAALFAPTEKGVVNRQGALRLAKKLVAILRLPVDLTEVEKELTMAQTVMRKVQERILREIEKEKTSEDLSQLFT